MLAAIPASLPVWLCVSSEKPSSKLEGARLLPGASCANGVGEIGACCAMLRWRMLCGVKSSHTQANVLAVAGIQSVMLVVLAVVWFAREEKQCRGVTCRLPCDLLWRRVLGIQDLSTIANEPDRRHRLMDTSDSPSDIDGSTACRLSALRASRSVGTTRLDHVVSSLILERLIRLSKAQHTQDCCRITSQINGIEICPRASSCLSCLNRLTRADTRNRAYAPRESTGL